MKHYKSTANETAPQPAPTEELRRNVAYARVWTASPEPITPGALSDELYGRGIMPGFTDPDGQTTPLLDAGLADARFAVGEQGFRILSLTSSRGNGCHVWVEAATPDSLPQDPIARRTVPKPRLVYRVEAGGPSNSDRSLCENVAEVLMLTGNGLAQIGGLGTKGNRPTLHSVPWVGQIKANQ